MNAPENGPEQSPEIHSKKESKRRQKKHPKEKPAGPPNDPSESSTLGDTPNLEPPTHEAGKKEVSPKPRRAAKIRYSDGLGWNEETETWWMHVRCGKRTHTRDTGKRSKRDAETWVMNFRREQGLLEGTDHIPHLTVAEGIRLWEANVELEPMRSKAPGKRHMRQVVRNFELWVLPKIGNVEVERLKKEDLTALVAAYRDQPGRHGPHSKNGVRNFIISLNIPLRWLHKTERIARLPRLPMIPKRDRKIPAIVPTDQFEELLQRFDRYVQYDLYAMIYIRLMALIGLRTSNARALLKSQFRNGFTQLDTKHTKNGNEYLLPVPEDIRVLLQHVPGMNEDEPLFPSPFSDGGRSDGWCLEAFRKASKDIGVTAEKAWHILRATYASALVEMGVDVFQLKELMTWETLSVATFYINVPQRRLIEAQNNAADLLLGRKPKD